SHDLEFILQTCSDVVVLDRGVMVGQGAAREVLADVSLMENHGLEVPWSLKNRPPSEPGR
ncbi:MAG: cobalt ABC transporter ATP-binding protein, partial [Gemmataceae bacterium]